KQLALACKPILERFIQERKEFPVFEPVSEQMQLRELYNASFALLAQVDKEYAQLLCQRYISADNFNDRMAAFVGCVLAGGQTREFAVQDFHEKWKNDKAVFNYWLSAQAYAATCQVEDLIALESAEGFDQKNPNHIRSVVRAFTTNLGCYHDAEGRGYRYVVDKILEVSTFNPALAHNYLAGPALQDFDHLPPGQQALMAQEMERLRRDGTAPPQTRDLVDRILKRYEIKNTPQSSSWGVSSL
ncbi:MAG: aminopeptidase N C-terminal domain-containing protein, partial [Chlamydiales bacterium]